MTICLLEKVEAIGMTVFGSVEQRAEEGEEPSRDAGSAESPKCSWLHGPSILYYHIRYRLLNLNFAC